MTRSERASLADRFLRLFTDIRPGESATALLLALNVFTILMAYYFIKPVRDTLILEGAGPEWRSYAAAGQAVLLLAVVRFYGDLASRFPRRRLINVVTVFFAATFVLFFLAGQVSLPLFALGIIFFLWVGIFNVMIVAQFWSFANDIYTREEGERLFPIVAFGASAGAVAGSFVAARVIDLSGVYPPILIASAILLLSLLITNYVDSSEVRRRRRERPGSIDTSLTPAASSSSISIAEVHQAIAAREEQEAQGRTGGATDEAARSRTEEPEIEDSGLGPFQMVFRVRYLLFIALLIMFLNWVNTTGEFILARVVTEAAPTAAAAAGQTTEQFTGVFYSNFYGVVNALALFIQLFLVSRIIKYLGMRHALLILPIISLGAYSLIVFYPLLTAVRWAKTAENSTDYSLQNTVRHALFLPCTREQKYKAKQAIDSFFWRAGDVLSAVVVFAGTELLVLSTSGFATVNMVLVAVWLTLAVLIGRRYQRLVESGRPPA